VAETLYQFDFSEDTIRKINRNTLFSLPVLLVFLIGFTLIITGFKVKEALWVWFITSLFISVTTAVEIPLINRKHRKIRVLIDNDKLVKQCGRNENHLLWDNISRVKIRENNRGEILSIIIKAKDKMSLWLFGLNEMEKLAGLIKERMPADASLNTKRNRLDMRVTGIISAVITVTLMTLIALLGNKAMDIFALFAAFGTSGFLLSYRPLSKMDADLKWIEIGCALFLILLGICGLISFLQTGRLP
jgi:hypothetical protein